MSSLLLPAGPLPASPPAPLQTALCGGLLPSLECLLRRAGRSPGHCETRLVRQLHLRSCSAGTAGLSWLLAYGDPLQAASFVASCGKVVRALGPYAVPVEEELLNAHRCQAWADGIVGEEPWAADGSSGGGGGSVGAARGGSMGLVYTVASAWLATTKSFLMSHNRSVEALLTLGSQSTAEGAGGGAGRGVGCGSCCLAPTRPQDQHGAPGDAAAGATAIRTGVGMGSSAPTAAQQPQASAATAHLPYDDSPPARQLRLMMSYAVCELLPQLLPTATGLCGRFAAATRIQREEERKQLSVWDPDRQDQECTFMYTQLDSLRHHMWIHCKAALQLGLTAACELAASSDGTATAPPATSSSCCGAANGGGGGGGCSGEAAAGWRHVLLHPERPGAVQLLGALLPVLPLLIGCTAPAFELVCLAVGLCRVLLQVCPEEVRRLAMGPAGRGAGGEGGAEEYGNGWRPEHFREAAAVAWAVRCDGCSQVALRLAEVVAPWWGGVGTEERARHAAAALGPVPCSASLLLPPAEARAALPLLARRCAHATCAGLWGDSEAGLLGGLRACGGCGAAWYCCRECQAADWRAGHREACGGQQREEGPQ